ncbi:hypothetical protein [Streptococcus thoraltensis]
MKTVKYHSSATSFDICADFSTLPLSVTNALQNTSDRLIIADTLDKYNPNMPLRA